MKKIIISSLVFIILFCGCVTKESRTVLSINWNEPVQKEDQFRKSTSFDYLGYTYVEEVIPHNYVYESKWWDVDYSKLKYIGEMRHGGSWECPEPVFWFQGSYYDAYGYNDENGIPIIITCKANIWVREDIDLPSFYEAKADHIIFKGKGTEYEYKEEEIYLRDIFDLSNALECRNPMDDDFISISFVSDKYDCLFLPQAEIRREEGIYYIYLVHEGQHEYIIKVRLSDKYNKLLDDIFLSKT